MILVTGSNGFIGRHMCRELDRLALSYKTINRQTPHHNIPDNHHITGTLDENADWQAILQDVDYVLHFAARVHVMQKDGASALDSFRSTNTLGTLKLAEQAAEAGVKRFIFASSIKVNGEGSEQPYTEPDTPMPEDAYAQSKWEAEQGLLSLAHKTGMEVVILRLPLVYGKGVGANFQRLAKLAAKGLPLPFGSIFNKRSLLYIGNLVSAVLACINHPASANQAFLLSDNQDLSTAKLFKLLAHYQNKPDRSFPFPIWILELLSYLGFRREVQRLTGSLSVDSRLIRETLDWNPPYSVEEGLKEMFAPATKIMRPPAPEETHP